MTIRMNFESSRPVGAAHAREAWRTAAIAAVIAVTIAGVISALSTGVLSIGGPGSTGVPGEVDVLFVVLAALGASFVVAGIVPLRRRRDR